MAESSILIVEDEHTLRRLLEYRLGKHYNVRSAANGEEALDLLEESLPDLIISDIMMPRMDGFALQAAIQERADTRAIPFIFLTAKADEDSRRKGRTTGVDDYITKPFDIDQLLSRVERLLERTKQFQNQLDARMGSDFSRKLIPTHLPEVENYRLFFHNTPREHGGGDIFDWTESSPGVYFITVGDVMGKGIQAKFYAFSFLGYIRSTLHSMFGTTQSPAELMRRTNQLMLNDKTLEDTFASLLLIRWEPATNTITYANAGHCRPVLCSRNRSEIVEYSDIVLGLDPNADFKDTTLTLAPGTALVSYTDGVLEQMIGEGEQLGEKGVLDATQAAFGSGQPVERMVDWILERSTVKEFADDVLVFWLERSGVATEVDKKPEPPAPRWFSPFKDASKSA